LTESEIKLDGVRQKILQVAQELAGEDMHQFHRAITTGEFWFTRVLTACVLFWRYVRQVLYRLSRTPSPFCSGYFEDRVSLFAQVSLDYDSGLGFLL
jgi:hypothetical protein